MATKVYQIRFLGINADMENITANELCSSSGISADGQIIANIHQISIEATPGTMFSFNGIETPFVIGATGVYEVFFDEPAGQNLFFMPVSVQNIQTHNQQIKEYNDSNPPTGKRAYAPLIVNIVYDE